jgi:predicted transporter
VDAQARTGRAQEVERIMIYKKTIIILAAMLIVFLGAAWYTVHNWNTEISDSGKNVVSPITHPTIVKATVMPAPDFSPSVIPAVLVGIAGLTIYAKSRGDTK